MKLQTSREATTHLYMKMLKCCCLTLFYSDGEDSPALSMLSKALTLVFMTIPDYIMWILVQIP